MKQVRKSIMRQKRGKDYKNQDFFSRGGVDLKERILLEKNIDRQSKLIDRQEIVTEQLEMLANTQSTDIIENVDILNSLPIIKNLPTKDYARVMGSIGDEYAREFLEENTTIKFVDSLSVDSKRDANASGYDLLSSTEKRLQVKVRHYYGKGPCDRQLHFETTRRHSAKNIGTQSTSGHVAYGSDEFDIVFLILIPVGKQYRNRKFWHYGCVSTKELIDVDNPKFLVNKISSDILKESLNWKEKVVKLNETK